MTPAERAVRDALLSKGWAYKFAREEAELARVRLHEAIREAVAAGISESEAARLAGVTRMTVRAALGKRVRAEPEDIDAPGPDWTGTGST